MENLTGADRRTRWPAHLGVALAIAWAFLGTVATVSATDCDAFAIWTTDPEGNTVNANIYEAKEDVYLNGGPRDEGGAAGEVYYYQVFAPDGTVLSDIRTVTAGEDGSFRVQLFPYDDTTNSGGEYKVIVSTHPAGEDGTLLTAENAGGCVKSDNFKIEGVEATPTPTPVVTPTPTPVVTPTPTPVVTPTPTPVVTPTPTPVVTPTPTPSQTVGGETPTPTPAVTPTPTPSETVGGATPTATPTTAVTPPATSTETPAGGATQSGLLLVLLLLGLSTTGLLVFSPRRLPSR